MIGVVPHQRRHIEVCGKPGLALRDQELETLVGVLAGAEARNLAHGPDAAAVHCWIRSTRERETARKSDVFDRGVGNVGRGVSEFDRKATGGKKLVLTLRLLLQESRNFL